MTTKLAVLALGVVLLSVMVSAPPEPPHRVYGEVVDESGNTISDVGVEFRYDSNAVVDSSTDSEGYYDVKIPYDSSYEGEELYMFVDGQNTTNSVVFESGETTELDDNNNDDAANPHNVYGTITDDGEDVEDALVEFIYDDETIADDDSDSSGDYSVDIPYDSSYNGENIEMYVEGNDTGKSVEFTSDGSTDLDFEADWLIDDGSGDDETDNEDSSSDDDSDEEDSNSGSSDDGGSDTSGGSGGSSSSDSEDEDDQQDSDSEQENQGSESQISFTGLDIPDNVSVGQEITLVVTLENTGNESGEKNFSVEAGGETINETSVTVEAGESESAEFSTSFDETGTYTITAGDLESEVTVEEEQTGQEGSSLPIIPIGVILAVLVTYIYLSRERILEILQSLLNSGSEEEESSFGWKYAKKNMNEES